jgi:hypothetical protein
MSDRPHPYTRLSPFDAEGQLWRTLTPEEEAVPDLALALARSTAAPGDEYASSIPTSAVVVTFDINAAISVRVRGLALPADALAPPAEVEGEPVEHVVPRDIRLGEEGDADV